jgi:hypothetical protein
MDQDTLYVGYKILWNKFCLNFAKYSRNSAAFLEISYHKILLKGPWSNEIFDLWGFHQTTPPRPLAHGPFWIWLRIHEENRIRNRRFCAQRHLCDEKLSLVNPHIFLWKRSRYSVGQLAHGCFFTAPYFVYFLREFEAIFRVSEA